MKKRGLIAFVASAMLTMAAPAMAQWSGPSGQMFSDWLAGHTEISQQLQQDPTRLYDPQFRAQYPQLAEAFEQRPDVWSGLVAQAPNFYDARFREFLANHPNVARELAVHPGYIYDANFVQSHPSLAEYLQRHGRPWRNLEVSYAGEGSAREGDYDERHVWHDYYWWHANRPDWFWSHHPEWAANEPTWREYDGDYDDNHQWHDRNWWAQNNANYVRQHHQDWGDWDDNRQWHDRDWWVQNRQDVVMRNHPSWQQQEQAYQQATRAAQIKAQQQRAAFEQQTKNADIQAKRREAYDQNVQKQADLNAQKRAAYDQNVQKQADLNAQKRAAYDQNVMKQADEAAKKRQAYNENVMKESDRRARQDRLNDENQGGSNPPVIHKMPPIHQPPVVNNEPPMHKMPPAGIVNEGPPMHKMPPITGESRKSTENSNVAGQDVKMQHHGKPESAPQGAVNESVQEKGGAGRSNQ